MEKKILSKLAEILGSDNADESGKFAWSKYTLKKAKITNRKVLLNKIRETEKAIQIFKNMASNKEWLEKFASFENIVRAPFDDDNSARLEFDISSDLVYITIQMQKGNTFPKLIARANLELEWLNANLQELDEFCGKPTTN